MKQILLITIASLLLLLSSCNDDTYTCQSEGTIQGADLTLCGCCGGWYISIDSTTYRFRELPANSSLNLENETMPLQVKLDWTKSMETTCDSMMNNVIKIHCIEKIN